MLRFFEEPINNGWVYPCSVAEIEARLREVPEEHLKGLWAAGLARLSEQHHAADGYYSAGDKPTIRLFSYPATYRYKQPGNVREGEIVKSLTAERSYGMTVEKVGTRYWCCWEKQNLKNFVLDYVLMHEVGHHVFWMQNRFITWHPRHQKQSEQFAEHYAQLNRKILHSIAG